MPSLSPSASFSASPSARPDVLDRVVRVDLEVALGLDHQAESGVPAELVEHVVEERHAGGGRHLLPSSRARSTVTCVSPVRRSTRAVRMRSVCQPALLFALAAAPSVRHPSSIPLRRRPTGRRRSPRGCLRSRASTPRTPRGAGSRGSRSPASASASSSACGSRWRNRTKFAPHGNTSDDVASAVARRSRSRDELRHRARAGRRVCGGPPSPPFA